MSTRKKIIPIIFLLFLSLSTFISTPSTSIAAVTDPPQITASTDSITYEFNSTDSYIWWLLVDDDPYKYQIYKNGVLGSDSYWQNGDNITLLFTYSIVGEYNITLIASDMAGNTASSTIWVTISEPASTSYAWIFLIAIIILPFMIFQRRKQRIKH